MDVGLGIKLVCTQFCYLLQWQTGESGLYDCRSSLEPLLYHSNKIWYSILTRPAELHDETKMSKPHTVQKSVQTLTNTKELNSKTEKAEHKVSWWLAKQPTTAAVQKVTFHPITLLSKPAEKRLQRSVVWWPSGDHATLYTMRWWPWERFNIAYCLCTS